MWSLMCLKDTWAVYLVQNLSHSNFSHTLHTFLCLNMQDLKACLQLKCVWSCFSTDISLSVVCSGIPALERKALSLSLRIALYWDAHQSELFIFSCWFQWLYYCIIQRLYVGVASIMVIITSCNYSSGLCWQVEERVGTLRLPTTVPRWRRGGGDSS